MNQSINLRALQWAYESLHRSAARFVCHSDSCSPHSFHASNHKGASR